MTQVSQTKCDIYQHKFKTPQIVVDFDIQAGIFTICYQGIFMLIECVALLGSFF